MRDAFVARLAMPRGYSLVTGSGNAALAYGIALGNSTWRFGTVAFVLALAVQVAALASATRMFRARNGASVTGVSGFGGPRSTRVVVGLFIVVLVPCIVGATWSMVAGFPVLSALVALCALPATAVADRWWMARYLDRR
ncbi:MAG TPA: hypothetical protein VM388_07895 [Acidimicrobiales bacterium]|nr:hypothetical protein [Acidimicrobiales bacterium]